VASNFRVLLGQPEPVVPGRGSVDGLEVLAANNNLDVCDHEGRRYLAWRTAPNHFASPDARLNVISSGDGGRTWEAETSVHLGRDVREPRFLSWDGRLLLYFFTLGTEWYRFEPDRVHLTERHSKGWTDPEAISQPGVVEWRPRLLGGVPVMSVYLGADTTYSAHPEPTRVELWTTDDGRHWRALDPDHPVAHTGGTETDIVEAPGGGWVAVTRMEGPHGWGSDVCRADAPGPRDWRTRRFPNKLDSPLLFRDGDDVLLVARRQVAFGGRYDLGWSKPEPAMRTRLYQLLYWATPKRTALWEVDPDSLGLRHLCDLPGRGDCCFPAISSEGNGRYTVYDYSSPLDRPNRPWFAGQLAPTLIYQVDLWVERDPASSSPRV
jgi:hypothetical protein